MKTFKKLSQADLASLADINGNIDDSHDFSRIGSEDRIYTDSEGIRYPIINASERPMPIELIKKLSDGLPALMIGEKTALLFWLDSIELFDLHIIKVKQAELTAYGWYAEPDDHGVNVATFREADQYTMMEVDCENEDGTAGTMMVVFRLPSGWNWSSKRDQRIRKAFPDAFGDCFIRPKLQSKACTFRGLTEQGEEPTKKTKR